MSNFFVRAFSLLGFLLTTSPLPGKTAEIKPLENFPLYLGGPARSYGMASGNFDDDPAEELIMVSAGNLAIVKLDGSFLKGFPLELKEPEEKQASKITAAPTVCDLNNDGNQDIVIGTGAGFLYVLDREGHLLPGFPVNLGDKIQSTAYCGDFDNDKKMEIIIPTANGVLHWLDAKGQEKANFKGKVGQGVETGAVYNPALKVEKRQLVIGGGDGKIHLLNPRGEQTIIKNFKTGFRITGTIALGDINDDGENEIIFGNNDFSIYAIDFKGNLLPNYPLKTTYRIYASPALADLDNDKILDVVIASNDGLLYALNGQGKQLWPPVSVGRGVEASPVIADLNGDGQVEIIQAGGDGKIYLLKNNGQPFSPPLNCGAKSTTTPIVGDFNHDGKLEIAVLNMMGELYLYALPHPGKYPEMLLPWPTFGHDNSHSGRFYPNAPRYKDLTITPTHPFTSDDLQVTYKYFDLDGDLDKNPQIRWYLNGKLQPELNNQNLVSATLTKKHQKWKYTIQEYENYKDYGENSPATVIFSSPEYTIYNTRPTPPELAITPETPVTTDELTALIQKPSIDADGDSITYRYTWLNGSTPQKLPNNITKIKASQTKKNETWTVVVTPFDGEEEGFSNQAKVSIINTKPAAPVVKFNLQNPKNTDNLQSIIVKKSPDADHDAIRYLYRWWLNGEDLNLPETTTTLPAKHYRKGSQIKLEVTPWDDEEPGTATTLEATYINSPPEAAKIAILPKNPRTTDNLRLVLTAAVRDSDTDTISYSHNWELLPIDGSSFIAQNYGWEIPASATKRGQKWQVSLMPSDDECQGPMTKASVIISNSAPTPPVVAINDHHPTTDLNIVASVISPATDVDGDSLTLIYEWWLNNKRANLGDSATELPAAMTKKHDLWTLKTYASDGDLKSSVHAINFTISNTPPTAPTIDITNKTPRSTESSKVIITKSSTDIDKDKLTYYYRWWKNGVWQQELPLTQQELTANLLTKGDQWRVEVTAFDGESESRAAYAQLKVLNSIPPAPSIKLLPENPKTTTDLICQVDPRPDPDQDQLITHYKWLKNGQEIIYSTASSSLPAVLTGKGDKWQCQAFVDDGLEQSGQVSSNIVTIINTVPSSPVIAIEPAAPTTLDELHCVIKEEARDPDLDPRRYHFRWLKDGQTINNKEYQNSRLPAKYTRHGEQWSCQVTADDGEARSPAAQALVTIANTIPEAAQITLEPAKAGQELHCRITNASSDVDGDKIRYRYTWILDGVKYDTANTNATIAGAHVKAAQIWQCQVTPFDGFTTGPTTSSNEIIIGN